MQKKSPKTLKNTSSYSLWEEVIEVCKFNFENCGRQKIYFLEHLIILFTDPTWSPSPKQGQNYPAANFCLKGLCFLMYTRLFTFYGPSQYLSLSRGRRVKKNQFSPISVAAPKKLPTASSISMPPTFHIASLNCYTPKFLGGAQKLTWRQ